jgi:hypothetical protein
MLLTARPKRIEGMNNDFNWSGSVPKAAVLPGYGLTYDTNVAAVVWWQAWLETARYLHQPCPFADMVGVRYVY